MILAKRVKKAFAYDAQGKLAPVSENIFTYSRRRRVSSQKLKEDKHECRNIGSHGKAGKIREQSAEKS